MSVIRVSEVHMTFSWAYSDLTSFQESHLPLGPKHNQLKQLLFGDYDCPQQHQIDHGAAIWPYGDKNNSSLAFCDVLVLKLNYS